MVRRRWGGGCEAEVVVLRPVSVVFTGVAVLDDGVTLAEMHRWVSCILFAVAVQGKSLLFKSPVDSTSGSLLSTWEALFTARQLDLSTVHLPPSKVKEPTLTMHALSIALLLPIENTVFVFRSHLLLRRHLLLPSF